MVFDLDGTLVDSVPDIARAIDATLADSGYPTLGAARIRALIGDGATKLVSRAVNVALGRPVLDGPVPAEVDVPALVGRFRAHYLDHLCDETRPYPGVAELLDALSAAGCRLTVLTNKPGDSARLLLDRLALRRWFSDVIGDGDGYPTKPAPDAVMALAARHGVAPARVLVAGDGIPDLMAARSAGVAVAAVTWGYVARAVQERYRPDWVVATPMGILDILRS